MKQSKAVIYVCHSTSTDFKKGAKICRTCYNKRQREKLSCKICDKLISREYLSKHLTKQHGPKNVTSKLLEISLYSTTKRTPQKNIHHAVFLVV